MVMDEPIHAFDADNKEPTVFPDTVAVKHINTRIGEAVRLMCGHSMESFRKCAEKHLIGDGTPSQQQDKRIFSSCGRFSDEFHVCTLDL